MRANEAHAKLGSPNLAKKCVQLGSPSRSKLSLTNSEMKLKSRIRESILFFGGEIPLETWDPRSFPSFLLYTHPLKRGNAKRHCKKAGCEALKLQNVELIKLCCNSYMSQAQVNSSFMDCAPRVYPPYHSIKGLLCNILCIAFVSTFVVSDTESDNFGEMQYEMQGWCTYQSRLKTRKLFNKSLFTNSAAPFCSEALCRTFFVLKYSYVSRF
jgi:hypothetical protein